MRELGGAMEKYPYKHTTRIPRWNYVKTNVSTLFQRGGFVGMSGYINFTYNLTYVNLGLLL